MTTQLAELCLTEQRPRDFAQRLARKALRGRQARLQSQKKARVALAALGAIALPAFPAPGEWQPFHIGNAVEQAVPVEPMPFELAGESFPGSAFYYLDLEGREPGLDEGIHSDAEPVIPVERPDFPAARSLRIDNSGIDRSRAEQCLAAAIYYEAASEADAGQRAVAQVVLNRVAHPAYPNTVCGVVFQGSDRETGCQFSFTCDGSLARHPSRFFWGRAASVARQALAGYVYAPAGLATHYHTLAVNPYWAPSLRYLLTIGAHRFYSFNGRAGQSAVFRYTYLGGEPAPVPHKPTSSRPPLGASGTLDPVTIQNTYESALGRSTAVDAVATARITAPAAAQPLPTYTAELKQRGGDALYRNNLPEVYGVREEYQNSGLWIASPAS
ncbi:cell wall hydrolase [Novosphingobium sp. RD2P27]|uniref:Cell wall hydrolase n=1 Tax=Novosphingobium kalidii TaxID=3230299 RepID=A0ABV2CZ96_9SPHN